MATAIAMESDCSSSGSQRPASKRQEWRVTDAGRQEGEEKKKNDICRSGDETCDTRDSPSPARQRPLPGLTIPHTYCSTVLKVLGLLGGVKLVAPSAVLSW